MVDGAPKFLDSDFGPATRHTEREITCNAVACGYGGTDLSPRSCKNTRLNFDEIRRSKLTVGPRNHIQIYDFPLPYQIISSESCHH